MWAHGAMEVEDDGTTVAINRPEFVEALQAFTLTWVDVYDESGLSWDGAANNRAFLSDQISGTFNGSSVYLAAADAKEGESTLDYEVVVDPADIWHAGFPEGPAGRFNALGSRSFAAMSYSPNARRRHGRGGRPRHRCRGRRADGREADLRPEASDTAVSRAATGTARSGMPAAVAPAFFQRAGSFLRPKPFGGAPAQVEWSDRVYVRA
jgi:hypothetical protein